MELSEGYWHFYDTPPPPPPNRCWTAGTIPFSTSVFCGYFQLHSQGSLTSMPEWCSCVSWPACLSHRVQVTTDTRAFVGSWLRPASHIPTSGPLLPCSLGSVSLPSVPRVLNVCWHQPLCVVRHVFPGLLLNRIHLGPISFTFDTFFHWLWDHLLDISIC